MVEPISRLKIEPGSDEKNAFADDWLHIEIHSRLTENFLTVLRGLALQLAVVEKSDCFGMRYYDQEGNSVNVEGPIPAAQKTLVLATLHDILESGLASRIAEHFQQIVGQRMPPKSNEIGPKHGCDVTGIDHIWIQVYPQGARTLCFYNAKSVRKGGQPGTRAAFYAEEARLLMSTED